MHLKLARERLAEANMLSGDNENIQKLMEEYQKHFGKAEEEVEKSKGIGQDVSEIVREIEESTERHRRVLQLVMEKSPEQTREAIQRAMNKMGEVEQKMERIREEYRERQEEGEGEQTRSETERREEGEGEEDETGEDGERGR